MLTPSSASRRAAFASEPGSWRSEASVTSTSLKWHLMSPSAIRVPAGSFVRIAARPESPHVAPLMPSMFTPLAAIASAILASPPGFFSNDHECQHRHSLQTCTARPRGHDVDSRAGRRPKFYARGGRSGGPAVSSSGAAPRRRPHEPAHRWPGGETIGAAWVGTYPPRTLLYRFSRTTSRISSP